VIDIDIYSDRYRYRYSDRYILYLDMASSVILSPLIYIPSKVTYKCYSLESPITEDCYNYYDYLSQITVITSDNTLLLSGANCVNIANIYKYNITHILNISNDDDITLEGIIQKKINIQDGDDISCYFDETYQWIDNAITNNGTILVHCHAGISRSPTIIIAYIMKKNKLQYKDAYALVKDIRPIIDPCLLYHIQLENYKP